MCSVPSKGLLSKDFMVSKHCIAPFSTSRGTTLGNVAFADDADKIVMQWIILLEQSELSVNLKIVIYFLCPKLNVAIGFSTPA